MAENKTGLWKSNDYHMHRDPGKNNDMAGNSQSIFNYAVFKSMQGILRFIYHKKF